MSFSHGFSIIIPSWNNLPYLRLCVESIRKNSVGIHQIIVHVNEGTDGTINWIKENQIEYTFSETNVGVCKAVNAAAPKAQHDCIVFMNDDMYACPGWDAHLSFEINLLGNQKFMLSATMIEPEDTGNPCVIVRDFGTSIENFRERELMNAQFAKENWSGSSWPPVLVPKYLWEKAGGFSEEFSPGFYSDPDFAMKLWREGCRIFKGVGQSRVYHFQRKSTVRVKANDGRKQFLLKWGILPSVFYKHYLRMGEKWTGALSEPEGLGFEIARTRSRLAKAFI